MTRHHQLDLFEKEPGRLRLTDLIPFRGMENYFSRNYDVEENENPKVDSNRRFLEAYNGFGLVLIPSAVVASALAVPIGKFLRNYITNGF